MKKTIISIVFLLLTLAAFAQWDNSGSSLTTSDNVGIGVSTLIFALEVGSEDFTISRFKRLGSGGGAAIQISNALDTHWSVGVGSNHYFGIFKSADPFGSQFIINENGNIGINDITPSFKLDINAGPNATHARFIGSHTGPQGIQVERSGGDQVRLVANYTGFGGGLESSSALRFSVNGNPQTAPSLYIRNDGNIGIGTTSPTYKLDVAGNIRSTEVKVEAQWWDEVFEDSYDLLPLTELKSYVNTHKHLPEIPTEEEVEADGVELGNMTSLLLKKIEEMTLYQIQLMEEVERLKTQVEELQAGQ